MRVNQEYLVYSYVIRKLRWDIMIIINASNFGIDYAWILRILGVYRAYLIQRPRHWFYLNQ